VSIHEILVVDKPIREMIAKGATTEELKDYAIRNQNMKTLKDSCIELVEQGITTMDEFRRVAYFD
jgi:type IV pilus assembly protein PilB